MSISKRLFDMARAELNSLLDKASTWEPSSGPDPDEDLYRRYALSELTDAELEAELERRHRARSASKPQSAPPRATGPTTGPRPNARRPSSNPPRRPSPDDEIRRAYAALEVPAGSDFETVRKSFRALMRKYHPDRHAGSPEKQKSATELTQRLTEAYTLLEKKLRR